MPIYNGDVGQFTMGRKPATAIKANVDRRAIAYHTAPAPYGLPTWAFNAVLVAVTVLGFAIGATAFV